MPRPSVGFMLFSCSSVEKKSSIKKYRAPGAPGPVGGESGSPQADDHYELLAEPPTADAYIPLEDKRGKPVQREESIVYQQVEPGAVSAVPELPDRPIR